MDSSKTKFQVLCTSSWTNKCSSECFLWQLYASLKIQEFSITVLHSTGLLSDYRILSFINKSSWSNTIPLNIRYVCIFNFIWHPLGNYLIFGIYTYCANWSYLCVVLTVRKAKSILTVIAIEGILLGCEQNG